MLAAIALQKVPWKQQLEEQLYGKPYIAGMYKCVCNKHV